MRYVVAVLVILSLARAARAGDAPPGMIEVPTPPAAARPIPLVPSVHRGHSVMWKTGAAITVASAGLTLLGALLTVTGLDHGGLGTCDITEGAQCPADPTGSALMTAGMLISIVGDGGLLIGGPATWIAGARRPRD
jgi:hypothetical protein